MKNFGRNPILSFGGVLLAALWLLTAAAEAATPGAAQVKKVVGSATYTDARGNGPIKEGDVLMQGATITTGAGSYVDLDMGVNGNALRVEADSTLVLNKLDYTKAGETIINTQLEVKKGAAVANVINKLSKASKYEIKTPAGVAGIRGTVLRAGITRITCLVGRITFVPLFGGGVAIVVNGGNAYSPGTLAAVRAGAGESAALASTATRLTANAAANQVATMVQQFTAALAAEAATTAGNTGGDIAKAASDTAKAAIAQLIQAVQAETATASTPGLRAAMTAVLNNLQANSEIIVAKAAGVGGALGTAQSGGTPEQARVNGDKAIADSTTKPEIIAAAKPVVEPFTKPTPPGEPPPIAGIPPPTKGRPGGPVPDPGAKPPVQKPPETVIFVSPDTAGTKPK